jgi:hypothetical protein
MNVLEIGGLLLCSDELPERRFRLESCTSENYYVCEIAVRFYVQFFISDF